MRIFIGFDVSPIRQDIRILSDLIKPKLSQFKDTSIDNYHLTLLFIGEVLDPQIFYDGLSNIDLPTFDIKTNHISCFTKKTGDIIFINIFKNDSLLELRDSIYRVINENILLLNSPYNPHITLFRSAKLKPLASLSDIKFNQSFRVNAFHVYQSHQVDGILKYTILKTFNLKEKNAY